jgi:hypothetical protein
MWIVLSSTVRRIRSTNVICEQGGNNLQLFARVLLQRLVTHILN